MTLHEAIQQVLSANDGPMTTREIADELNKNGLYSKKDGSVIIPYQIHGRTKNYPHLFDRDGSTIFLKSKTGIKPAPNITKKPLKSISDNPVKPDLAVKMLMNEKNFKSAGEIDGLVPDVPGLYCIRIKESEKLPSPFDELIQDRNHNILYIGQASKSLKKRFLGQELRAKGHGSFFRSIGAVLGFKPERGSLVDKSNKNNYTFSREDKEKIVYWVDANLWVNWVEVSNINLDSFETNLIREHLPLLNITHNPAVVADLVRLRDECRRQGCSTE